MFSLFSVQCLDFLAWLFAGTKRSAISISLLLIMCYKFLSQWSFQCLKPSQSQLQKPKPHQHKVFFCNISFDSMYIRSLYINLCYGVSIICFFNINFSLTTAVLNSLITRLLSKFSRIRSSVYEIFIAHFLYKDISYPLSPCPPARYP